MNKKVKFLVTSVGSLVGQNIQDVLEFPGFNRRDLVELIGTNSIPSSPNNYRCDKCYLVSNTGTSSFIDEIKEIIKEEKPDLILSGRDEDSVTLARLIAENSDLTGKTPYGKLDTLTAALNKWETAQFCERHQLPFAATFVINKSGDLNDLKRFTESYGFPLIAKPIEGFASKGVFFVRNWADVEAILGYNNYMFQEYLGNADNLKAYFRQMDSLVPLFAHAPNIFHHSCHTVVAPDGSFDPIFISRNEHDSGVTVGFKKASNQELEELTINFANAIARDGGYGPVTVQFREDKHGNWKAQEINMRTNGNTYPRFLMGQDDIGLIMRGILPEFNFPIYHAPIETRSYIIGKYLLSNIMHPEALNVLVENKCWTK